MRCHSVSGRSRSTRLVMAGASQHQFESLKPPYKRFRNVHLLGHSVEFAPEGSRRTMDSVTAERFLGRTTTPAPHRARTFLRTSRASCWPPTGSWPRRPSSRGSLLGLTRERRRNPSARGGAHTRKYCSLSEKYAGWADYRAPAKGFGVHVFAHQVSRPIRLTDEALRAHPEWRNFGDEVDDHHPMRRWLAVPLIGSDGENDGFIQASDRLQGEFTEQDETHLVRLAAPTSTALDALAQLHLPGYRRKVAARPAGSASGETRPSKRRMVR
jgi:hypothetical protein